MNLFKCLLSTARYTIFLAKLSLKEKIIAGLILSIPWLKAGLAGQGVVASYAIVTLGLFIFLTFKNWNILKNKGLYFLPLFFLLSLHFVGSWNPRYESMDSAKWKLLNLDSEMSLETDPKKIELLNNHYKNIYLVEKKDPHLGLSIFFNLKNIYLQNFGNTPSPSLNVIEKYEKLIEVKSFKWIPQSIISSVAIITDYIHITISLILIYLCYLSFNSRKIIRRVFLLVFVSSGALALVGIYQKINYLPTEDGKEILGIWDTPEPRYFYSTFTYKNHWSCFAILCISVGFAFLTRHIRASGKSLLRSNFLPIVGFILCLLIISIIHSGSRSGILIFILLFLAIAYFNKTRKSFKFVTLFFLIITCIFIFNLSKGSSTDMKINTQQQIEGIFNGELPLRVYLWSDLLKQISDKTFWGHGFNSYRSINPIYQSQEVLSMRNLGVEYAHVPYTPLIGHGHNDWLELISEIGWFGFSIVLLPGLLLTLREILTSNSNFSLILFLGILSYILFSVIDFPIRTPACFLTFCCFLGLSLKYSKLSASSV